MAEENDPKPVEDEKPKADEPEPKLEPEDEDEPEDEPEPKPRAKRKGVKCPSCDAVIESEQIAHYHKVNERLERIEAAIASKPPEPPKRKSIFDVLDD